MNYLKEINSFYDLLEINPLSSSAIALWFALMHINNKCRWKQEFTVALSVLELKTSLKRKTIERARNELRQKGLIDWKSRKGNQAALYSLKSVSDVLYLDDSEADINNDLQGVAQNVAQDVAQSDVQTNEENNSESLENKGFNDSDSQSVAECVVQPVSQPVAQSVSQCVSISKLNKTNTKQNNNNNIASSSKSKKQDFEKIFKRYNKQGVIQHKSLTEPMIAAMNKFKGKNKHLELNEILEAIDHYGEMYNSNYAFCEYKWGLEELFTRTEGITKFTIEGSKWLNYIKWRDEEKPKVDSKVNIKTKAHNFQSEYDTMGSEELDTLFRDN